MLVLVAIFSRYWFNSIFSSIFGILSRNSTADLVLNHRFGGASRNFIQTNKYGTLKELNLYFVDASYTLPVKPRVMPPILVLGAGF